ncbi:GNAT family protein [soil metagenome]
MTEDLIGPRVVLRPVRPEHHDRLRELHLAPGIVEWWQLPDPGWPVDDDPDTHGYAVLLGEQVVGFVQWYAETDPMYRHAGIDLFLDPAVHGQGLGIEVVRTVCVHLVDEQHFHRLVIDPEAANTVAIRCYGKVGFRPVGVLRQYSRDRHGRWHDGLLMDLLAAELVRG